MSELLKRNCALFLLLFLGFIIFVCGCDDQADTDPWDDFTYPTIVYINRDADGSGAIFDQYIPDPEEHVAEIAKTVSRILYHEPDEVPLLTKITVVVAYFDGVASKSGDRPEIKIKISSKYLQEFLDSGGDVLYEIDGILHHEITHGYQYDDGGRYSQLSGVIEGVADTVRYYAGYIADTFRHKGGNWCSAFAMA